MKNRAFGLLACTLAVVSFHACYSVPKAAKSYCRVVVREQGAFFAPLFPPQQGVQPAAILELHLARGWDTDARECIPFSSRRSGRSANQRISAAPLPVVWVYRDSNGLINLGGDATQRIPMDVFARAGLLVRKEIQIAFEGVSKARIDEVQEKLILLNGNRRVLNDSLYEFAQFKGRRGPDSRSPNSLWFLQVEEVYLASTVLYGVSVSSLGGGAIEADLVSILPDLNLSGSWNWSADDRVALAAQNYDPPLAIGVAGTLVEVDSRSGTVLRSQHFPFPI